MELPEFSEVPGRRSEITWHYGRWIFDSKEELPPAFWLSRPQGTLSQAETACREANVALRGALVYHVFRRKTTVEITHDKWDIGWGWESE